jgi:hypothetical protein
VTSAEVLVAVFFVLGFVKFCELLDAGLAWLRRRPESEPQ